MPTHRALLLRLLTLLVLCLGLGSPSAPARADDFDDPRDAWDRRECICDSHGAGACQHWLRNPRSIPDDDCWCHKCRETEEHTGNTLPDGFHDLCFNNKSTDCFLKRHAVAWGITCSECVQIDDCCGFKGAVNCPNCDQQEVYPFATDAFGKDGKATVLAHLEREKELLKKSKNVTVAYTKHHYLATDIDRIKVRTKGGAPRILSNHEWAHLMLERAQHAYRDWTTYFPAPNLMGKTIGIFLTEKDRDQLKVSNAYLGSAGSNVLLGGDNRNGPAGDFCLNGMCESLQATGDDDMTHMTMRHMLGHLYVSTWGFPNPTNRALPRWMNVGAAHWLARLPSKFREMATICHYETNASVNRNRGGGGASLPTLDGAKWDKDLAKMAKDPQLDPIEKLFGKTSANQLTQDDHKRAWSYFDLCCRQWNAPWAAMLGELRKEQEIRDVFVKHLECTPEIFDERWRDCILGRRKSMNPKRSEDVVAENEDPTERERKALLRETDPATVAAKVRALGTVDDPRTAVVLVDLLARREELIRAAVMLAFLKTKDPAVHEAIWKHGLTHPDDIARAYTARACGRLGIADSVEALDALLEDKNWYARAEAALAIGQLRNIDSMTKLRTMVSDPSEKARVAAMDALALFGEDAFRAVEPVTGQLEAGAWQLRIAAAQALGKIGRMEAVEPLIKRMELESGRVREECHLALKEITRDDLGRKPEHWREWWEKLKVNTPGGGLPGRPPETGPAKEPDKPDPDDRYAKQTYYGIELYSSRVGFVIDTSGSMNVNFVPSPAAAAALSRPYSGTDKLTICKEEVAFSLLGLDPRAHFNIISFGTTVRTFKKNPVPASSANVQSGISFLKSLPGNGETNYYDALRAILDLGDGPDEKPDFRNTPDTLTFLTDGTPTRGEITDGDTLLEWYVGLNRFARVKTHVICFGNSGVDFKLLTALAERNGGKYVHVPEVE